MAVHRVPGHTDDACMYRGYSPAGVRGASPVAARALSGNHDPETVHGSVTGGGVIPVPPSVCDAFCSACWYFA